MKFSGTLLWQQPIVYIARSRRRSCLYVGMSRHGLGRPSNNPTLRKNRHRIAEVEIIECETVDQARQLESSLIKRLRPRLKWAGRCHSSIQVNPNLELRSAIAQEGRKQNRPLGPMVLEMVKFYFRMKDEEKKK